MFYSFVHLSINGHGSVASWRSSRADVFFWSPVTPRQGRDSWRARSTRRSNSRKCSGDLNAPPPTPAMPAAWTGAPSANPMAGSVACKGRVRGADNKVTAELQRELQR